MTNLKPWQPPHVARLVAGLKAHRVVADTSETGTGKTFTALAAARELGAKPLVICPVGTIAQWKAAAAYMGVEVHVVNYEKVRGAGKHVELGRYTFILPDSKEVVVLPGERAREVADWADDGEVILGSYLVDGDWKEQAKMRLAKMLGTAVTGTWMRRQMKKQGRIPSETDYITEVKRGRGSTVEWKAFWDMIIFDEAHRGKGRTSLESKLVCKALAGGEYVLLLSATLIETPMCLAQNGVLFGLHSGRRSGPGSSYDWLMRNGCRPSKWGGLTLSSRWEEVVVPAIRRIRDTLANSGRLCRMARKDIPGFPETLVESFLVAPTEPQKAEGLAWELHEMGKNIAAGVEDDELAITRMLRLRQGLELQKLTAMKSLMVEALQDGSAVVVALNFHESIDQFAKSIEKLDLTYAVYDGRVTPARRAEIQQQFCDDELDVIILQSAAGAEGLNLQHPVVPRETLISPDEAGWRMKQLLGRVHRAGGSFSRQRFIALSGTYEEKTHARLQRKLGAIDQFNDITFSDSDFRV